MVCTSHPFASKRAAVSSLCVLRHGIEGDVVGIVNEDEIIELEVPGESDRFLRHAFLQAAVAGEADEWWSKMVCSGVLKRAAHLPETA